MHTNTIRLQVLPSDIMCKDMVRASMILPAAKTTETVMFSQAELSQYTQVRIPDSIQLQVVCLLLHETAYYAMATQPKGEAVASDSKNNTSSPGKSTGNKKTKVKTHYNIYRIHVCVCSSIGKGKPHLEAGCV